jgi:hypothetical protein
MCIGDPSGGGAGRDRIKVVPILGKSVRLMKLGNSLKFNKIQKTLKKVWKIKLHNLSLSP